jgi:hypothetical protein
LVVGRKGVVIFSGDAYERKREVKGGLADGESFLGKVFLKEKGKRQEFAFSNHLAGNERPDVGVEVAVKLVGSLVSVIPGGVYFREKGVIAVFDADSRSGLGYRGNERVGGFRLKIRVASEKGFVIRKVIRLPDGLERESFQFGIHRFHFRNGPGNRGDAGGVAFALFGIFAPFRNGEVAKVPQEPSFQYGGLLFGVYEIPSELFRQIRARKAFGKPESIVIGLRKEGSLEFFEREVLPKKRRSGFVFTENRVASEGIAEVDVTDGVDRRDTEDIGVLQFGIVRRNVSEIGRRKNVGRGYRFLLRKEVDGQER